MKVNGFKEMLLSKDELLLHQAVIEYLVRMRKQQQSLIKSQTPNLIPKKYNLLVCFLITFVIVFLNFDQLFTKVQAPSQLATFQNFQEVQRKVEYVFEHTIMKYSVIYPMKLIQCQSYIPFVKSETLCSQKSIDVKAKLLYQIGFRPNYEKLSYSPQNNSIGGEWGPLQILSMTQDHDVQTEINGFINGWSVLQFQTKYRAKIKAVKPHIEQKINEYIENITSNENSLQKFEQNIKKSLMKIMNDGKQQRKSISDRILNSLNKGFDKLLIFLNVDPLLPPQPKQEYDEFSPQSATQFYKQQIFIEEQEPAIASKELDTNKPSQNINSPQSKNQKSVHQKSIDGTKEVQAYNSEQIRLKYNELLKKVK